MREVLDVPGTPYIRLQTSRLGAQLLVFEGRFGEMPLRLLEAAEGLDAFSREQSRQTLLDAMATFGLARELADSVTPALIAQTSHELAPLAGAPVRATDLLLESYCTTIEDGFVAAAPALRASVTQWVGEAPAVSDVARWSILAVWAALELWDVATLRRLVEQDLRGVRERHALPAVQTLLYAQSTVEILDGRFAAAAQVHDEARALAEMIDGNVSGGYLIECELRSWQGDDDAARPAIDAIRATATAQGFGQGVRIADLATAVLANGHGRYLEAAEAASRIVDDPMPGYVSQGLAELVEATSRIGRATEAQAAATRLRERATVSGTSLAMGIAARSDALLAPVGAAEALFTEAIRHIGATTSVPQLARSHLLLGEWLRRQRRRADARVQPRAGPRAVRRDRGRGVRRSCPDRARGHREDRAAPHRGHQARADAARAPGRDPRDHGLHQQRDRGTDVRQRQHRRLPPPHGVPEARDLLPSRPSLRVVRLTARQEPGLPGPGS